jgi:hypothetical protein
MNERIKKLAEQCWDRRLDGLHFDQEQFAELIVRECGVALSPMLRDMVSRGQAFDLIKKHFGVE